MHQLQRSWVRRHSGIWGAAGEAVLNIVRKQNKKSPPIIFYKKNIIKFDTDTGLMAS